MFQTKVVDKIKTHI